MSWFRRLTLRGRLILIGTIGLALGLAIGGIVLVTALARASEGSLDANARQTARDVGTLVETGFLSDPIPITGTQIVQVIDDSGAIRAASLGADRLVPLLGPANRARAVAGNVVVIDGADRGQNGPLRVVAVRVRAGADFRTVIVAAPAGDLESSARTLRTALLVAYPVLLGALAITAWWVVGWALRPVEALRRGAEDITGAARVGRLPVPDGQDEVHRLAVTLNGMLDRLEAARQRQRTFVGDAAHELRSPLASLRTQLEVAERLGEPVAAADLLPDVQRLGRLVDDLLLLARADEGDPRLPRSEPVDLADLLTEVAETYRDARVPVTVAAGPLWTTGNRDGLRRLADNLVSNAVRHARTRVTLATTDDGFTVADDGPGIPPVDRERVFDRFTRLDDARARDGSMEGAGLGLAIVRELVRLHGGSVTLDSAHPGLLARVRVPVRSPSAGSSASRPGHPAPSPAPATPAGDPSRT